MPGSVESFERTAVKRNCNFPLIIPKRNIEQFYLHNSCLMAFLTKKNK